MMKSEAIDALESYLDPQAAKLHGGYVFKEVRGSRNGHYWQQYAIARWGRFKRRSALGTVSYTHLTLPTTVIV